MRRILAVALGLALIVLSVAPYIKARELTMETPSGWEVLGSKRLKVPLKELQEIYAPDGTPTGRYGRPIDHGWFGEGKLIEIGGTYIWVLDTYQDARGCHVRVRVENLEGELTTAGGQSQGVQWGNLRLYITWAKFPPEEGDWRTAKGEYFYGFEEFELTLYRIPTAPAIPLSAAGVVLGVGLVLFGVAVIREGERRGILPILIGSAFLCALIITYPGGPPPTENIRWARISWVGAYGVSASRDFSKFAVHHTKDQYGNIALSIYDKWGKLIGYGGILCFSQLAIPYIRMTPDGSKVLSLMFYELWTDGGVVPWHVLRVFSSTGALLWKDNDVAYYLPSASSDGSKIIYVGRDGRPKVVNGANGQVLYTFSENLGGIQSESQSIVSISDDGSRVAFGEKTRTYIYVYSTSNWSLVRKFTAPSGFWIFNPVLSGNGAYIIMQQMSTDSRTQRLKVYSVDTGSEICSTPDVPKVGYSLQPFSADSSKVAIGFTDFSKITVRIVSLPAGTYEEYSLPYKEFNWYALAPSGNKVVFRYGDGYVSVGTGTWTGTLTPYGTTSSFIQCSDEEFIPTCYGLDIGTVFVAGFKYKLEISTTKGSFSVDDGAPTTSYSALHDPDDPSGALSQWGGRHKVKVFPPEGYVLARVVGNLTEADVFRPDENSVYIYMDNNKSITDFEFLGRCGTPVCSPLNPKPTESVSVSWSKPDGPTPNYYELQIDNVKEFTHPTTYTQIVSTSYSLSPPGRGWELGIYYVRVRAAVVVNSSVVYSYWSDPAYFEVNVPLPPEYVAVNPRYPYPYQKVSLSWSKVSGVTTYRVSWDGNTIDVTGTSCELSPPTEGWVAYKTYTVDVYSYYQGNLSETPAENDFTVTPFPAPSWVRVENKYPMPEDNVRVTWEGVEIAKYYDVALDENTNIIATHLTENIIVIAPPSGRWSAGTHRVFVRAVDPELGASAWVYDIFSVQPVIGPAPPPPTPPAPGKLQLAAMVPMLPHPLVSAFNSLGQVAGVYTLSLLMVLGGLGLITMGLRKVP